MIFIGRFFYFKKIGVLNFPGQTWFEYLRAQNTTTSLCGVCGGHVNVANFCAFYRISVLISVRTMISTNQTRRSSRIRNRALLPLSSNQGQSVSFTPKLKYRNSFANEDGVFFLSKRKRSPPTAAEIEEREQKRQSIQIKKVSLVALRHKVVSIWEHGMHTTDFQFGSGNSAKIIKWMQSTYPAYEKKAAAKSFFYRALKRFKTRDETPELEPHRDKRGENKKKTKRENPAIVACVDELLSEEKSTAPKVQRGLRRNGFDVSLSTIYRIAKDLCFRWQKPCRAVTLSVFHKFSTIVPLYFRRIPIMFHNFY